MPNNDEFVRSVQNATVETIAKMVKKMNMACLLVESDAKTECPVDQGILRASMISDISVNSSEIVGTIGNSLETAPYVHQGTGVYAVDGNGRKTPWKYEVKSGKYKGWHITVGQKAKPFLETARNNNKDKIIKILGGR